MSITARRLRGVGRGMIAAIRRSTTRCLLARAARRHGETEALAALCERTTAPASRRSGRASRLSMTGELNWPARQRFQPHLDLSGRRRAGPRFPAPGLLLRTPSSAQSADRALAKPERGPRTTRSASPASERSARSNSLGGARIDRWTAMPRRHRSDPSTDNARRPGCSRTPAPAIATSTGKLPPMRSRGTHREAFLRQDIDTVCESRSRIRRGHDTHAALRPSLLAQQREHLRSRFGVEVPVGSSASSSAGRARARGRSPRAVTRRRTGCGDSHAPARRCRLRRAWRRCECRRARVDAARSSGKPHVACDGKGGRRWKAWNTKPIASRRRAECALYVRARRGRPPERIRPASGTSRPGDEIEQRRFACADLAHDRHELAAADLSEAPRKTWRARAPLYDLSAVDVQHRAYLERPDPRCAKMLALIAIKRGDLQ